MANKLLAGVVRWIGSLTAKGQSPRPVYPRRPDDQDDGVGVLVPVGPRPRRDGAQAKLPQEQADN